MIYLRLFLTFLKIGAVSFGGGYAMISLIRESVLANGWLSDAELLNLIAVSESTPGPIAINMATFIGSTQGGLAGSFFATLGVVLPSFFIILIIAAFIRNFLKYRGPQAFLRGVRPCIIGLIIGTAVTMLSGTLLSLKHIGDTIKFDPKNAVILIAIIAVSIVFKKTTKKAPSPILLILISAALGMILFSI